MRGQKNFAARGIFFSSIFFVFFRASASSLLIKSLWLHHMLCILMKFGTVVDLNEKTRMQKKIFRKTPIIYGVMIIFKKRYFCSFCIIAHA